MSILENLLNYDIFLRIQCYYLYTVRVKNKCVDVCKLIMQANYCFAKRKLYALTIFECLGLMFRIHIGVIFPLVSSINNIFWTREIGLYLCSISVHYSRSWLTEYCSTPARFRLHRLSEWNKIYGYFHCDRKSVHIRHVVYSFQM